MKGIVGNVPLLQKALDHIEAHPEEWDQSNWGTSYSCGTAACLAGHITLIDGWAPVIGKGPLNNEGQGWHGVFKEGEEHRYIEPETQSPYEMVDTAAMRALGMDRVKFDEFIDSGRGYLFSGLNERDDLWSVANAMTGGQLTLPVDLQEEPVAGF